MGWYHTFDTHLDCDVFNYLTQHLHERTNFVGFFVLDQKMSDGCFRLSFHFTCTRLSLVRSLQLASIVSYRTVLVWYDSYLRDSFMFKEPCSDLIFSSWIENLAEKEVEKSGNFQKKSQESSRVILPYFFPE